MPALFHYCMSTFLPVREFRYAVRNLFRRRTAPEKGEPYIRVEGLHIDKVKFHPDKKLLQKVNQDFFATRSQLTGTVTPNERIFNEEERLALLNQYFTEYRSITIKEYADLTALPHTAASKELHAMAASPNATLSIEGGGSHIRFTEKRE